MSDCKSVNYTLSMTLFCPVEQSEAQKSKYYNDFVAAFNDLVCLKRKLKESIDDICEIILTCGFHVLRYYLEAAVKRVIYFVDKCDLHYKGKCIRRHQKKTEQEFLISEVLCHNLKGSFESDDQLTEHPPKLTARSFLAMYYFKVCFKSKSSSREIDIHEKGREIDQMKILAYKLFETDVYNTLHKRSNIKKVGLTTTLRGVPDIKVRITKDGVATTKANYPNADIKEDIWVTNMFNVADFDIFKSDNSKMNDNIMQLKLNCPRDADNNVLYDHKTIIASEDNKSPPTGAVSSDESRSGKAKSIIVPPAQIDAMNVASGVGKRKFVAVHAASGVGKREFVAVPAFVDPPPPPTNGNSGSSESPVVADRYVTAHDHTPHETDTPSRSPLVVVRGGGKRRRHNHQYNVQAADALSTNNNWWDTNEQQEAVTDKDIAPAFKKLSKDRKRTKTDKYATVNQQTPRRSTHVVTTPHHKSATSDVASQQHNNFLSVDLYKMKSVTNSDFAADIAARFDDTKLSVAVAHLGSHEKQLASEEDDVSESLTLYQDITSASERDRKNAEIDHALVAFLVKHAVTEISRDITLETVLIDYMMRKGILNAVDKAETQIITNWNDIFLSIEKIIIDKIKQDTNFNKSVLSVAYTNSLRDYVAEFKAKVEALECDNIEDESSFRSILQTELERRQSILKTTFTTACNNNEVQAVSTTRKVSRSLYFIATKVCFVWAKYNKCMDILAPEQIKKYAKSCESRDSLRERLAYAQTHQRLLVSPESASLDTSMSSPSGSSSSSSSSSITGPQGELVEGEILTDPFAIAMTESMEERNLAQNLQNIIENIKVSKEEMKNFAAVVWAKVPREQFSMKPRGSKKDKTAIKAAASAHLGTSETPTLPPPPPPSAASVACMAKYLGKKPSESLATTTTEVEEAIREQPQQEPLTNRQHLESPCESVPLKFRTPYLLPSVRESIESYDAAACLVLKNMYGCTEDMVLLASHKKKHSATHHHAMIQRLQCIKYFLRLRSLSVDDALFDFSQSTFYGMFTCSMWLRSQCEVDSSTIRGDGYCFVRAVYQCYLRESSGYQMTVEEMRSNDRQKDDSGFPKFLENFQTYIKDETPYLHATHEVKMFKLRMDSILWRIQLQHRPQDGLPVDLWGSQADVALIKGNVTSWEEVKQTHPIMNRIPSQDSRNCKWMRYCCTSLDIVDDGSSVHQPSLKVIDSLGLTEPNFICFNGGWEVKGNHFFIIQSPTQSAFQQIISEARTSLITSIFQAVELLVTECPNISSHLDLMIHALQHGADSEIAVEVLDYTNFEVQYHAKFSKDKNFGTVNLLDDNVQSDVSKEVATLVKKIDILKEKESILMRHHRFMRTILMPESTTTATDDHKPRSKKTINTNSSASSAFLELDI